MFLLRLRQARFSNAAIKFLGLTPPFLYFKKCDISNQIQQKRPSETPVAAPFRGTYAPTSKN